MVLLTNSLTFLLWSIREYKTEEEEEGKPYYLFHLEETSTEDDSKISAEAITGSIFLRTIVTTSLSSIKTRSPSLTPQIKL